MSERQRFICPPDDTIAAPPVRRSLRRRAFQPGAFETRQSVEKQQQRTVWCGVTALGGNVCLFCAELCI